MSPNENMAARRSLEPQERFSARHGIDVSTRAESASYGSIWPRSCQRGAQFSRKIP